MKTVQDILDVIEANRVHSPSPELRKHASELTAARQTGSTTKLGLDEVPGEIPVEEVFHRHVRPGCRCYRFTFPMGGRLGVLPLSEAFVRGSVGRRLGRHGAELYITGAADATSHRNADDIYVIIGTYHHDGSAEDAVFTWHPDEPMPTLDDGISGDTAVKIDFGPSS